MLVTKPEGNLQTEKLYLVLIDTGWFKALLKTTSGRQPNESQPGEGAFLSDRHGFKS